jgi:hypothetical protein
MKFIDGELQVVDYGSSYREEMELVMSLTNNSYEGVHCYDEWTPLKEVLLASVLGANHTVDTTFRCFYGKTTVGADVHHFSLSDDLIYRRQAEFQGLKTVLESRGVIVREQQRYEFLTPFSTPYWRAYSRPSDNPRDQILVLGDTIVETPPIIRSRYFENDAWKPHLYGYFSAGSRWITAPDFSGENVKPQIIPDYNGEDVILKGTGDVLKTSDFPELKTLKGRTLITTDGTTLLGADDKAGVAEIMTAAEQLISSDIPHGDIWIGFTPDEEVGRGADLFDLDYFKADFAYTVDGDYEGEVAYENFNAASAVFAVKGVNVHPGEAKDIMVNAALVACEIQSQLPPMETPAHTEGREGFYHLTDMSGDVAAATLPDRTRTAVR